ncbi:MFS transporter, partial [Escherichia coli]
MKQKLLIIIGLIVFIIGGVGAGYMHTVPHILIFRAVLGLGTGIILPFSTGLIAGCFDGELKTRMMGYSSATNSLGAIVGNILAGILAVNSWHYMFHIYWMGALVLIVVLLFLNHLPDTHKEKKANEKLTGKVYRYSFYAFLTMMVFYLIVTNLPFFVDARGLGSPRTIGFLFAVNSS